MSGQSIDSNTLSLAGNNRVRFSFVQEDDNESTILSCEFESTSSQVPISSKESIERISSRIVGLAFTDLAELNIGSRVILSGDHLLDRMIEEVVDGASGVSKLSAADQHHEESVDAFIGCDLGSLVRSMPSMRRSAVVVITCELEGDAQLDLYSTLHRKGLRIKTLDFRRDIVAEMSTLTSRFERLTVPGILS